MTKISAMIGELHNIFLVCGDVPVAMAVDGKESPVFHVMTKYDTEARVSALLIDESEAKRIAGFMAKFRPGGWADPAAETTGGGP